MGEAADRGVPASAGWLYALPALPLSALLMTFYVFLPKLYTDHAGVGLGTMGGIILFTRMWDALLDPLIGRLSDRTRSRWGRRRPWLAAGALPLGLCAFLISAPHLRPGSWSAAGSFGVLALLFFLFWTAVSVPFEAWGAELTNDYDERTKILAKRDGAVLLGTVLGTLLPSVAGLIREDPFGQFRLLGLMNAILVAGAVWLCVARVPEPGGRRSGAPLPAGRHTAAGWRAVLRNRPFLVLVLSYAISSLGAALPASLILYYVEDVLGSAYAPAYLLLYLLTGCVFLPLWVRLAGTIEKKTAWLAAMAMNTAAFSGVFFLESGQAREYAFLVFLSGIGAGASLALPSSMQADVIDYDEWLTGERREGLYVGLWSVVKKASAGLGAALGFLVLDRCGYQGGEHGAVTEPARLALRVLYAGVPCACNFLAIAAALPYPLSRSEHSRIRKEIEERAHGNRGDDQRGSGISK